jgi:alpha-D-ribose 1-methylphosphonate 5-triphosphate synthase subunit PhnG
MVEVDRRRRWMSVLATAAPDSLEAFRERLDPRPAYDFLRGPETGLVMVRGRAGGTGMRFNLGEIPVTRCSVRLDDGTVGHAYVGGRDARHAELAALFDALLQNDGRRADIEARLIEPLAAFRQARRQAAAARSAPTRVEFFTMVRGEE